MRNWIRNRHMPLVLLVMLVLPVARLSAQTGLQRVGSGMSSPIYGTAIPGDTNRLFILEQGTSGTANIRSLDLTTNTLSTFMTISGLSTGGERGLLGLAFHPDYASNGYFYTYTSVPGGTGDHMSQLRRYRVLGDPATSNAGDPASATPVLSFSQPYSNHNGGWIGFNPNLSGSDPQYLHIGSGDGGSGNDPGNRAQDITNQLLGKMLRIDVNGDDFPADPARNYSIPATNPFVGVTGDDEIWDYGLRNPWRNSFDRATGDLWIGDVGQGAREEIDLEPAGSAGGLNYGWRVKEGNNCFDNSQAGGNPPCNSPLLVPPVHEYPHGSGTGAGNSVTGGYVYRGSIAQFQGLYFFADFVNTNVWTLDPYAVNVTASVLYRNGILPPNAGSLSGVSSFAEDARGELYVASYNNGNFFRVQSTARSSTWNGDADVGVPGDGSSWGDPNNWTRDATVDGGFLPKDEAIFAAGSSQSAIQLGSDRVAGGVRFQSDYTLTGNRLTVLSGNITVDSDVTATMQTILAAETANSSLRKLGAGTLLVDSTAGQTVVLQGTLGGNGTLEYLTAYPGGTVSPGTSIGTLTVTRDFRQLAGAVLTMEVSGSGMDLEWDQLAVGDEAFLGGRLDIIPAAGYSDPVPPGTVDRFALITAAAFGGSFDEVSFDSQILSPTFGPDPDGSFRSFAGEGLFRVVDYSETGMTFENYRALPGDANGDQVVDGTDFNIWNANKFTSATNWITGDFNGDQVTDGTDFGIWNANKFTAVVSSVPEPVFPLGLLLACPWARRFRRPRED